MPKLLLAGLLAFAVWCSLTLTEVKTNTARIALEEHKQSSTKAALGSTACIQCHGGDSGNMLPIRKTMNQESFTKWVRGTRPFVGYNSCPILPIDQIPDAEILRMYRILYTR